MARNAYDAMWAEAVSAFSRVDRLHRDFFRPVPQGWEPPIDLLQTDGELVVVAALPGVRAEEVGIVLHDASIVISGVRRSPNFLHRARVLRMELPHGRFERHISIPPGRYELTRREIADGLLIVALRGLG